MADTSKAARQDEITTAPRPQRLDTGTDLRTEVAAVRDTDDLHRVYVQEWISVYLSEEKGDAGYAEVQAVFAERWEGRVTVKDYRFVSASDLFPKKHAWAINLRLWNMRAEFRYQADADHFAAEFLGGYPYEVVVRNSAADYKLRDYGVKKVPA